MSPEVKDRLGYALIVGVLALALSCVWYVSSYARSIEPVGVRTFTVSGDGKAVAIPDIARLSFHVLTEGGQDIGALQEKNTTSMNAILSFLKDQGIEPKDIRTSQYSITPRMQYANCGLSADKAGLLGANDVCPPPTVVGYSIDQGVDVNVRAFEKIGAILSGVVQRGANNVSGPSFALDDPASAENAARADAIEKAQAKARAVASAGGFTLGRIITIDEGGQPQPIYAQESFAPASMGARTLSPVIEAGSQDVRVTVTIRYEIE